jgi:hypothetical protein
MTALGGRALLVAWAAQSTLGRFVTDTAGQVIGHFAGDGFFGELGAETAGAMPSPDGLLIFDGNPVRATELDFGLGTSELGRNQELLAFGGTVPRVAGATLNGRPVAFWLTTFPTAGAGQASTPHQLYGCALDPAAAADGCAATAAIASTGLAGSEIAAAPVVAAALPGSATFAIAHSDAADRTWLRLGDLGCARPRD